MALTELEMRTKVVARLTPRLESLGYVGGGDSACAMRARRVDGQIARGRTKAVCPLPLDAPARDEGGRPGVTNVMPGEYFGERDVVTLKPRALLALLQRIEHDGYPAETGRAARVEAEVHSPGGARQDPGTSERDKQ
jgi:hypothetical protein